ncbi:MULTISPECIES: peptidylprolyl isomerase [Campylobacter]|uniref:Peptidylprolyl isomerase n=1 Tax=Campylobacter porcelli TaxID=1660073 RepID=A0A1X9SX91_9BACT|nr:MULTISPECIES: peptidylprolyl isomerase [unclassified Campylobacter]ARR00892.1 SurA-like chaperone / peptidyl-prolyl cis-trans isomerase [Campylobacter sp. RM6137]MCR8696751.1 peptidylprolyl isomerase [Campylobacter sp. RM19073]MEE3704924.1 peptidylprolyl isomerase [Campylobacter sp. CX2-8023-23]MEE3744374.1 peptidylprolyl isomerase [Campylobacter sp. CX2-4855-23]
MKKGIFLAPILAASVSLNAAVLATVNGKEISDKDLAPLLGAHGADFDKIPEQMKKQLLEMAINGELILEQAKKDGTDKTKEYQEALKFSQDNVLRNVWTQNEYKKIKVSNADVKAFYEKNKETIFVSPAQAKAKHILVETQKEAEDIIAQLKGLKGDALTAKFSELAKTKSIDRGSAANGGELGWFDESRMVPAFSKAAFGLKNGTITIKPVKSEFGYHVILKEDSKAKTTVAYDKVKNNIEEQLRSEQFKTVMQEKMDKLRQGAKVEYK